MTQLVVEQSFDPPLTDEAYDRMSRRIDPCLAAYAVTWRRSFVSTDRRRMICAFEAADAEAVRAAYRSAGEAFDRVWVAEVYEPAASGAVGS
jgi:hypothetical protein